jgi:aryl sulfotransferase
MAGIVWLASYPKSGNTWFRIFLANLLSHLDGPVDINDLPVKNLVAAFRNSFDDITGIGAADLTPDEVDRLRPRVYETMAENVEETLFLKIHDAYTRTPEGEPLIPHQVTRGAVYIVRNPLDIAVSFAHHSGEGLDRVIARMGDPDDAFASEPNRLHRQLRQKLLGWSGHVGSWLDAPDLKLHVLHYEDMHRNPSGAFTAAVRFLGLGHDADQITRAIASSAFGELQRQEQERGFDETNATAPSFFRKGRVGAWRDELTDAQVDRLIGDHGRMMERLGYLDGRGNPIY